MGPLPISLYCASGRNGPHIGGRCVGAQAPFLGSSWPCSLGFPYSHKDTAAKTKATAWRALLASNTSYTLLWSLVEGRAALEAQQELEDR